jgi:diguanylate cyclase (GGDEF)-like protein
MFDWKTQFATQRRDYLQRTAERLAAMDSILNTIAQYPQEIGPVRELNQHFHQLAGSSAIYELDRLGDLAAQVEKQLLEVLRNGEGINKAQWKSAKDAVESMKFFVAQHPDAQGISLAADSGTYQNLNAGSGQAPNYEQQTTSGTGWAASSLTYANPASFDKPKDIVIVDGDQLNLLNLTRSLEQAGMTVRGYRTAESAKRAIAERLPDGLILCLPLIEGPGYDIAQELRRLPDGQVPPVLIISRQIGFLDKVMAIRSGADAFFDETTDPLAMVKKLQSLFERDKPNSYTILSVEDDPTQADFIRQILQPVGYNVQTIADPRQFEEALLSLNPDLLLLDVMLGPVSGFELARFVRSDDRYAATPIIFLTTQNQLNAHVEGARVGGDEYLIKPVAPPLLISAVAGRLERYRVVKKLIGRDALTQFLTLGSFMEAAEKVLGRRYQGSGSLVMLLLDIDHLETINETFGFAYGDKVISSFAKLLKSTIRNAEIVARTDGDEFAVVVDGINDRELADVATQCIRDFEALTYNANGQVFNATASAGAAALDMDMDLKTWVSNARIALKSAKSSGRNCVMKAKSRTPRY